MDSFSPTVDVIIPVCKPGKQLAELISRLERQTVKPRQLIIINTGEEYYDDTMYSYSGGIKLTHITEAEFDHGKTRHEAIMQSDAKYCLLMTQDALPYDTLLVEKLLGALSQEKVAVAYARQVPRKDCRAIERLARGFNYPEEDRKKTWDDIETMGIKAFFCSDVCAMYDRNAYIENGGFIRHTIFNEDMIMAYNFLKNGLAVYYCAQAKVIHSHNYTNMQQFHRNFDLGVSQADNPEVFGSISSESEGVKYILKMTKLLFKEKHIFMVLYFYINSAFRLAGYKLGKNYKKLPMAIVKKCSMNSNYWRQE